MNEPAIDVLVANRAGVTLRHDHTTVQCDTGLVTQQQAFADGQTAACTDLAYFPNGNVQQVTEPANAAGDRLVRRFNYDTDTQSRVTCLTDSFGYVVTASYDPRFGEVESTTDANQSTTSYTYDGFGRLVSITGPNEQGTKTPTVSFEYHPTDRVPWAATHRFDAFHPGDTIDSAIFLDGLGRVIQEKNDGSLFTSAATPPAAVMRVSGQIAYDAFGRPVAQRFPTTEAAGTLGVFNPAIDAVQPATVAYDVLNRAVLATLPDDTTSSTAFGFGPDRLGATRLQTTVKDANGVATNTFTDMRGLTTAVQQFNNAGKATTWTSFTYDALDRMTQSRDDHDNLTTATYDLLGRRTSSTSPDSGRTRFIYDLSGNLVERVTANLAPQQRSIRYDYQYNRLTDVVYPSFPERCVHYVYGPPGAANRGADRIVLVNDAAGSELRAYGKMGEVTKTVRTVRDDPWNGEWRDAGYLTQFSYDSFGRLGTLTYPDGEVLSYGYDAGGALQSAKGLKWGRSYDYVDRLEYDAFGAEAFYQAGNLTQSVHTYDPRSRRLAKLQSTTHGYAFQDDSFAYDPTGNVLSITNAAVPPHPWSLGGKTTQTFTYDPIDRLTNATATYQMTPLQKRTYAFTQTYDSIHGITSKQQVDLLVDGRGAAYPVFDTTYGANYHYGTARPHAPARIGDRELFYDFDGNQVAAGDDFGGPQRRTVWDDEDRLEALFDNGGWQSYSYDDVGDRMVRSGNDGISVYVNEYLTIANGAVATKHVFAGASRVVSKQVEPAYPPFLYGVPFEDDQVFYHEDPNGNVNFTTDAYGALNEHLEYFPFGEPWVRETAGPAQTPYLSTGKEIDPESGLYYFGARYYDARASTWLSADPLGDGYEFAGQNPQRFIDRDGRAPRSKKKPKKDPTSLFASGRDELDPFDGVKANASTPFGDVTTSKFKMEPGIPKISTNTKQHPGTARVSHKYAELKISRKALSVVVDALRCPSGTRTKKFKTRVSTLTPDQRRRAAMIYGIVRYSERRRFRQAGKWARRAMEEYINDKSLDWKAAVGDGVQIKTGTPDALFVMAQKGGNARLRRIEAGKRDFDDSTQEIVDDLSDGEDSDDD